MRSAYPTYDPHKFVSTYISIYNCRTRCNKSKPSIEAHAHAYIYKHKNKGSLSSLSSVSFVSFIAELHAGADNELNVVKAVDFHPSPLADPAHLGDLLLATAADP